MKHLIPVLLMMLWPMAGAAQAGILHTAETAPTSINLTTEGTQDWVKYSYDGGLMTTAKAGGSGIGALQLIGNNGRGAFTYAGSFDWSDGDNPISNTGVTSGAFSRTWGGNTLRLIVDADTTERQLVLYLMRGDGTASVTAELSDGGSETHSYPGTGYNEYDSRHVINFAAQSAGQTLTVTIAGVDPPRYVTPRAGLAAVTLAVVPEPASVGLVCVVALATLRRWGKAVAP